MNSPQLPRLLGAGRCRVHASIALAFMIVGLVIPPLCAAERSSSIAWWLTTEDLKHKLAPQPALTWEAATNFPGERLTIDPQQTFQSMLGLGSSLEPSTCSNLWRMTPADRERTIERLVSPTEGIGMNLVRVCIGTPDFTGDPWYSYDDLPAGQTDQALQHFSIAKDRAYILPILRLAREKNPALLFFASPWSPPGWMKSTGNMIGGQLLPASYPVYAEYFVKFICAYEAEGIPIYAVTIQNEPGVDRAREKNPRWFYPSCRWTGEQERDFIRDHLGPAFRRHGLSTRIWCYDHNYNVRALGDDPGLGYPRAVLSDPAAAAFVSGVAFHGYAGSPSGMSTFQGEFPQTPIYFTEGSIYGIKGGAQLVAILRNWASGYNAWVTVLDDSGKPNNGPFRASRTIITFNRATSQPVEHLDLFVYGQFMKFIPRGAVRVGSEASERSLANVAFRSPDGTLVLVVVNSGRSEQAVALTCLDRMAPVVLPGRSVSTFIWQRP